MSANEYRARPDAYTVELDGEALIWLDALQQLHRLNVPASLVWSMLNGWTTASVIAEALANRARPDEIVSDVAACIEQLAVLGVVDRRTVAASQS